MPHKEELVISIRHQKIRKQSTIRCHVIGGPGERILTSRQWGKSIDNQSEQTIISFGILWGTCHIKSCPLSVIIHLIGTATVPLGGQGPASTSCRWYIPSSYSSSSSSTTTASTQRNHFRWAVPQPIAVISHHSILIPFNLPFQHFHPPPGHTVMSRRRLSAAPPSDLFAAANLQPHRHRPFLPSAFPSLHLTMLGGTLPPLRVPLQLHRVGVVPRPLVDCWGHPFPQWP